MVTISNILHLKASKMHQINTKISKNLSIGNGGTAPHPKPHPIFDGKQNNFLFCLTILFFNPGYGPGRQCPISMWATILHCSFSPLVQSNTSYISVSHPLCIPPSPRQPWCPRFLSYLSSKLRRSSSTLPSWKPAVCFCPLHEGSNDQFFIYSIIFSEHVVLCSIITYSITCIQFLCCSSADVPKWGLYGVAEQKGVWRTVLYNGFRFVLGYRDWPTLNTQWFRLSWT